VQDELRASVDFVVHADVPNNDLMFMYVEDRHDSMGVCEPNRVLVSVFSFQALKLEPWVARVLFKLS
jgi:hypothetical protein